MDVSVVWGVTQWRLVLTHSLEPAAPATTLLKPDMEPALSGMALPVQKQPTTPDPTFSSSVHPPSTQ